jgi:hypothetical protein
MQKFKNLKVVYNVMKIRGKYMRITTRASIGICLIFAFVILTVGTAAASFLYLPFYTEQQLSLQNTAYEIFAFLTNITF